MYTYSIWWIINQRDWFYYHGDEEYLQSQREYLVQLLDLLLTKVDDKGFETSGGGFLDWPSNANQPAMRAGTQALMMWAMKSGEELCKYLGEEQMAARCKECYDKMVAAAPAVVEQYFKEAQHPTAPGSKQGAACISAYKACRYRRHNSAVRPLHGFIHCVSGLCKRPW